MQFSRRQLLLRTSGLAFDAAGLALLGGCGRLPWQVDQPARRPRIGFLGSTGDFTLFLQGLGGLGYVDGQTIAIEPRFDTEDRVEQLLPRAAELVRSPVDILVVVGTGATTAAHQVTEQTPIVMVNVRDPVGSGFIVSLARPGANITGLTNGIDGEAPEGKWFELLAVLIPGLSRVAVLASNTTLLERPATQKPPISTVLAAQGLGLQLQYLEAYSDDEIQSAFETATLEHADALVVRRSNVSLTHQKLIVDLAASHQLPAMYVGRDFVVAGGLMAFGPDDREKYSRVAHYVDRLLKGASPADLPVEQPTTYELAVNQTTAQTLGLTIPPVLAAQVTEWIS